MGWTVPYGSNRKSVIEESTRGWTTEQKAVERLRHCTRGNVVYALMESRPANTEQGHELAERWILVVLVQRWQGGDWGYKTMDEGMGPYYYHCPLSYLDACTSPMNAHARDWRKKVRDEHAHRKAERARVFVSGTTVELVSGLTFGGTPISEVVVVNPQKGKLTLIGQDPISGMMVRVKKAYILDESER